MISVEEAKKLIIKHSVVSELSETINCRLALKRILNTPVVSPTDHPPFNQSAMDGYGITFPYEKNQILKINKEIKAGDFSKIILTPYTAVRLFTGAMVPQGIDAIVVQENTKEINDHAIKILQDEIIPGSNIRLKGSQIKAGEVALQRGTVLTPAAIGFLAALGISNVTVKCIPEIRVLVTGNELQQTGSPLNTGRVYESNGAMLNAALLQTGVGIHEVEIVKDSLSDLIKSVKKILQTEPDILILTGGVSVGNYDLVKQALETSGTTKIFHKVAQKPGKPLYFGIHKKTMVFGLPGNPAAALTSYYEYILPSIKIIMGQQNIFLPELRLKLLTEIKKKKGLALFLKGKMTAKGIEPLEGQESYLLKSFAEADALIFCPESKEDLSSGEEVEVHVLPK